MSEPIYTEKQCSVCGYVFMRYLDHGNIAASKENMREQKVCPQCDRPQFVVEVKKPGESL